MPSAEHTHCTLRVFKVQLVLDDPSSYLFFIHLYSLLFYWHFLVLDLELLPQFWPQGHEIFSICGQWYEDLPQERIFGSHPHSRLQAQKGVSRVGLEALLLTLEHPLLNTSCQGQYKESFIFYEFSDLTPTASSRLKKVSPEQVWRPFCLLQSIRC